MDRLQMTTNATETFRTTLVAAPAVAAGGAGRGVLGICGAALVGGVVAEALLTTARWAVNARAGEAA